MIPVIFILHSSDPACTVSPSGTIISSIIPETGAGIEIEVWQ